jgi:hypothetical protein
MCILIKLHIWESGQGLVARSCEHGVDFGLHAMSGICWLAEWLWGYLVIEGSSVTLYTQKFNSN